MVFQYRAVFRRKQSPFLGIVFAFEVIADFLCQGKLVSYSQVTVAESYRHGLPLDSFFTTQVFNETKAVLTESCANRTSWALATYRSSIKIACGWPDTSGWVVTVKQKSSSSR